MARFLQILMQDFQQMTLRTSGCASYNIEIFPRIFFRNFSKNSKYPVKLAYKLFEPKGGSNEDKSPLIFLHGVGITKELSWGNLPQAIVDQTKRKAYTLDARNHGDSERSNEFSIDLNIADILHFIDEKRHPKVVIIGHSMGGVTAIKAALKVPEKIDMLFVEDVFIKGASIALIDVGVKIISAWKEVEKLIPPELNKNEADRFITQYVYRKQRPQNKHEINHEYRFEFPYPLKKDSSGRYIFNANLDAIIEAMKNDDFINDENEGIYDGPAYFLYAKKSPFQVAKEKHHILKSFPRAVIIPFEGENHFIHSDFPDQFIETVVKCIKLNENEQ